MADKLPTLILDNRHCEWWFDAEQRAFIFSVEPQPTHDGEPAGAVRWYTPPADETTERFLSRSRCALMHWWRTMGNDGVPTSGPVYLLGDRAEDDTFPVLAKARLLGSRAVWWQMTIQSDGEEQVEPHRFYVHVEAEKAVDVERVAC